MNVQTLNRTLTVTACCQSHEAARWQCARFLNLFNFNFFGLDLRFLAGLFFMDWTNLVKINRGRILFHAADYYGSDKTKGMRFSSKSETETRVNPTSCLKKHFL